MIRRLYVFLIQCHPRRFRQQFGDQMLSIFDESIQLGMSFRLLIDVVISLLRQWVLRSEYWSRPAAPLLAGNLPSLEEVRRSSGRLQKKANRANLVWVLSFIPVELAVAMAVRPTTHTFGAQMIYTVLPIAIFFSLYLRCSISESAFVSIQYRSRGAQAALTRNRDAFQARIERMGLSLILSLVIWCCPVLIAGVLLRSMEVVRTWAFVNAVVFGIETFIFFTTVSAPNRRALTALQQEIEATSSTEN